MYLPDKVLVKKGKIYLAGEEKPRASTNDVLGQIGNFTILGKGARGPNNPELAVRTFGAQFAEVEVNTLTGEVRCFAFDYSTRLRTDN